MTINNWLKSRRQNQKRNDRPSTRLAVESLEERVVPVVNLSGVINDYAAVTSISGFEFGVDDATGFVTGDTVMVIQMEGATQNGAGNVDDIGNAGKYEINQIASVAGNRITLAGSPLNAFNVNGAVQIVRVPNINDDVTVTNIAADPWDGTEGGVLAFISSGTVTLNSSIEVNSDGFREGLSRQDGENISGTQDDSTNLATNGGGAGRNGFLLNTGGGGGGSHGAGGRGGFQTSGTPGQGGQGLGGFYSNAENRVFFGGGGGASITDNNTSPPSTGRPGGPGGGIVFIQADEIIGNAQSISANGGNAPNNGPQPNGFPDAGGGGGGAGVVVLDVPTLTGDLNLNAVGGRGNGHISIFGAGATVEGGGGSGGGGVIWTPNALPNTVVTNVAGGVSLQPLAGDTDALPGQAGETISGLDTTLLNRIPTTEVTLAGGVLTITDILGGDTDDDLTLSFAGGSYTLTDNNNLNIQTAIAGAQGSGTSRVTFSSSGVTGIVFNTLGGDDTINVDGVQAGLPDDFTIIDGLGTDTATVSAALDAGDGAVNITAETITTTASGAISGNGGITLTTDDLNLGGNVSGSGTLTITPQSPGSTIGLGGGAGTLNLIDDELALLQDGFSSITIGDVANGTGDVTLDTATFLDPVTLAGADIISGAGTDVTGSTTFDGDVEPGGTGAGAIGQMTVDGDVTFDAAESLTVELNDNTTPGTDFDQVRVEGAARTVNLNGSALNVSGGAGFNPDLFDEFVIVELVDPTSVVVGEFAGLPNGTSFTLNGVEMAISYDGGDGNDVVLTVVPDFGDARASYGTATAFHEAVGPTLGASRDGELMANISPMADGDDNQGADDEDGVTMGPILISPLVPLTGTVQIDLQNADGASNRLDAFIDFNLDGDFLDPGEKIFDNFDLGTANGVQELQFTVPDAFAGNTMARFRVSTAGGLNATEAAADGEIEDHQILLINSTQWELFQNLNLFDNGNDFFNSGGLNERWVQGNDGQYYFLTPDGKFFRWGGDSNLANDRQIAHIDPNAINTLDRFFEGNAGTVTNQPLHVVQNQFQFFRVDANHFENSGGMDERWFKSASTGAFYYILQNGDIFRWEGGSDLSNDSFIVHVDPDVYDNLNDLFNALTPQN